MIFLRVHWTMKGEHVHARVFVAREGAKDFAHCGNLIMHGSEFVDLTQGRVQTEFHFEAGDGDQPAR